MNLVVNKAQAYAPAFRALEDCKHGCRNASCPNCEEDTASIQAKKGNKKPLLLTLGSVALTAAAAYKLTKKGVNALVEKIGKNEKATKAVTDAFESAGKKFTALQDGTAKASKKLGNFGKKIGKWGNDAIAYLRDKEKFAKITGSLVTAGATAEVVRTDGNNDGQLDITQTGEGNNAIANAASKALSNIGNIIESLT